MASSSDMLTRYLNIEQEQLEHCAQARQAAQQYFQQQEMKLQQLYQGYQAMAEQKPRGGIGFENQAQMKQKLRDVIDIQYHQCDLAYADLERAKNILRGQLSKVKGLEQLQQKKKTDKQLKAERALQKENDDWVTSNHGLVCG